MRWKPERRFLLRGALALKDDATGAKSAADVFVRFFADERGARIERTATALRAAGLDDLVPEPLGALDDGRLFVERTWQGERALDAVLDGRGDPHALVAALLRLRATTVDLPNAPAVIQRLATLAEEWEPALRIDADLRSVVGPWLDRLRAEAPRAGLQATVHGDLHLQQVLERDSRVGLVDWECAARGDPLFDLGWFAAQRDAVPLRDAAALDRVHHYFDSVVATYRARAVVRCVAVRVLDEGVWRIPRAVAVPATRTGLALCRPRAARGTHALNYRPSESQRARSRASRSCSNTRTRSGSTSARVR
ncbi:MAG: phosphotransferase [Planctomycetes bacterium]|nr:phosphotransferase [Planctomycetota bacterium]